MAQATGLALKHQTWLKRHVREKHLTLFGKLKQYLHLQMLSTKPHQVAKASTGVQNPAYTCRAALGGQGSCQSGYAWQFFVTNSANINQQIHGKMNLARKTQLLILEEPLRPETFVQHLYQNVLSRIDQLLHNQILESRM